MSYAYARGVMERQQALDVEARDRALARAAEGVTYLETVAPPHAGLAEAVQEAATEAAMYDRLAQQLQARIEGGIA